MSFGYVVRPRADRDIDEIAACLAENAGLEMALEFLAEIHETFGQLAAHHNMGWLCNLSHPKLAAARTFRVSTRFERHLIFYLHTHFIHTYQRPCRSRAACLIGSVTASSGAYFNACLKTGSRPSFSKVGVRNGLKTWFIRSSFDSCRFSSFAVLEVACRGRAARGFGWDRHSWADARC